MHSTENDKEVHLFYVSLCFRISSYCIQYALQYDEPALFMETRHVYVSKCMQNNLT
jgi:hypothetical protein